MIAALALLVGLVVPGCWQPPVDVPVAVPFRAPACTWCPGHRGLEFRPVPGTPVRAVADGRVVFAGPVVGVNYLVVQVADGRRITFGQVAAVLVRVGDRVRAGQVVARSSGRLFLGVRLGNHYVDPAPLLAVRRGRVRLVPVDRKGMRPAGSAPAACAAADPAR